MLERIKKASNHIRNLEPENIAGYLGMGANTALLLAGGMTGSPEKALAAVFFFSANGTMAKFGQKTSGYAMGGVFFGSGNAILASSPTVPDGSLLQISLMTMTAAWVIGASRYPLEKLAKKFKNATLQKTANIFQPICGATNLTCRMPGIIGAALQQDIILTGVMTTWAINDTLTGRLQGNIKAAHQFLKNRGKVANVTSTPKNTP